VVELLRRLIREELLRMRGSARRGPLRAWNVRDGRPVTTHDGFAGELLDAVIAEPYGLASRPPTGTRMVLVQTRSGDLVAIAAEDTSARPSTDEDEVVLYTAGGAEIRLKPNGDISLHGAGGAMVELQGADVILGGGVASVARQGDACTHTLTADLGTGVVSGTIFAGPGAANVKA